MSVDAIRWAFSLDLQTGPKFVLVALADHADDRNICFPGLARLMRHTGLSRSGVRLALRQLEQDYQVITVLSRGNAAESSRYLLHVGASPKEVVPKRGHRASSGLGASVSDPGHSATPGMPPGAPPGRTQSTPGGTLSAQGGCTECALTTIEPPLNHHEAGGALSAPPAPPQDDRLPEQPAPKKPRSSEPRAHRLPEDWQPSESDVAYAQGLGLDPVRVAENFRDYWLAKGGDKARKTNWSLTWKSWCREDKERRRNLADPKVVPLRPAASAHHKAPYTPADYLAEFMREMRESGT
jgi:Helix-turn-helix domain